MLRQDQLSGLLALAIAWLVAVPAALILGALALQTVVAFLVLLWGRDLHAPGAVERHPTPTERVLLLKQLLPGLLRVPALWASIGFATLALVCNAVMLSGLAFLLEAARAGVDYAAVRARVGHGPVASVVSLVVFWPLNVPAW